MSPEKNDATIRVRQIRSGIGFDRTQKATLKALGLGRLNRVRVFPDNPQVRGMIRKVSHLVAVEENGPQDGRS
jgi:large subunit ribosomal protein L30